MTDLSLLGLFFQASLLVKLVMLILFSASVFSWMYIIHCGILLNKSKKQIINFEDEFYSGVSFSVLYGQLEKKVGSLTGGEKIFYNACKDLQRLSGKKNLSDSIKFKSIEKTINITLAKETENLEKNIPFLATVQSISPYIGLFGTVWGIMHAFRQLASVQQATIAMVAPGISEALVATAMGLVAAIPAGIAYNKYVNKLNWLTNHYVMLSDNLLSKIQEQL